MFRKNTKHQQPALISAASELPEKQRKHLEKSWAQTFYTEFFSRIDEEAFSSLYSNVGSRPNIPVNVLVGLEALKTGFGWSDQDLYENYCFNIQVRYSLGYDRLGDGDFEIRSLYNFRERLSRYNAEQGINLLEKAFEGITDVQIKALKLRTGMQRMDSTQIASNIVTASRLQLMVESLQRVERILTAEDKQQYAEKFTPYIRDSAGHFTYRVKGKESIEEHMLQIGETMQALIYDLHERYEEESAFKVMERLFGENFILENKKFRVKENQELDSNSLQSVDDLEASYRVKGKNHYRGYVANITETCDPENEFQLITKVQVAPNNVEDTKLLLDAMDNLIERTELETLYTDGGYGSPEVDNVMVKEKVEQIQTGIRGREPHHEKLHLTEFEIKLSGNGKPTRIQCPQGQMVEVQSNNKKNTYVAHFSPDICETCPLVEKCPSRQGVRDKRWHLRFTQAQINVSLRRKRNHENKQAGRNIRAAVESTVREMKHHFRKEKLPVRGLFRMSSMMIESAMMSNVRRIHRYLEKKELGDHQVISA